MDKILGYVRHVALTEGFAGVKVYLLENGKNETSGLCSRNSKIIWIKSVVPSGWTPKNIWELCLHEVSHLFKPNLEITLKDLEKMQRYCRQYGCNDVESHTISFWKNFNRLKRKYPFEEFLLKASGGEQ